MPWVVRQGFELWCLGVVCLLVSSASLPGALMVRVAADVFGVGGIALVAFGVLRLGD
ncbi:hypothetical protein [Nocardioides astragali]|uniref:Uncharacterized protein n=1 Tax=Nocardioides astragali TaxID=1776736 RepID=A0ABW2N6S3_9ACTN|nr:hypothetical protein [Nocardioides astragali]